MVVGACVHLLAGRVYGVSVGCGRVADFEKERDFLRRLGMIGNEVGKTAGLVTRATGEIRVEQRAKWLRGLWRLERHSQNGFRVGFGEQLACCLILRIAG